MSYEWDESEETKSKIIEAMRALTWLMARQPPIVIKAMCRTLEQQALGVEFQTRQDAIHGRELHHLELRELWLAENSPARGFVKENSSYPTDPGPRGR